MGLFYFCPHYFEYLNVMPHQLLKILIFPHKFLKPLFFQTTNEKVCVIILECLLKICNEYFRFKLV